MNGLRDGCERECAEDSDKCMNSEYGRTDCRHAGLDRSEADGRATCRPGRRQIYLRRARRVEVMEVVNRYLADAGRAEDSERKY